MRFFYWLLYVASVFGLASSLYAIQPPWADTSEPMSPWGHNERMEARESWFRGMSWDNVFKPREPKSDFSESQLMAARELESRKRMAREPLDTEVSDIPDNSDLSEIPWQSYESEFPRENFKTKLLWPVEGGRLSSGYGFRNGRVHEGIDISAPIGNSIRAASDGRVVYSGFVSGYGKIVVIYHGGGVASIYAHNAINLKNKGDSVRQGETIAHVGKSGDANGSHCHFEIRENGKPTNPLKFTYIQSPLFAQR